MGVGEGVDDLTLMAWQVAAAFVVDGRGRLRFHNEPGWPEEELERAPRFFMGRTRAGHVWRVRDDVAEATASELERLCRTEPVAANLRAKPVQAEAIRALLAAEAPITGESRGPSYWIHEGTPVGKNTVLITAENAHVLLAHFPWKAAPPERYTSGPLVAALAGDGASEGAGVAAVAICYCARLGTQAAEAGVETAEGWRRQGYASAAVAGWAAAVRRLGLMPFYGTGWENVASQGVARRLGMVWYGDEWSVT